MKKIKVVKCRENEKKLYAAFMTLEEANGRVKSDGLCL